MTQLADAICIDSQRCDENVKATEPLRPLGYNDHATTGRNAMHDTLIGRYECTSVCLMPVVPCSVFGGER